MSAEQIAGYMKRLKAIEEAQDEHLEFQEMLIAPYLKKLEKKKKKGYHRVPNEEL